MIKVPFPCCFLVFFVFLAFIVLSMSYLIQDTGAVKLSSADSITFAIVELVR